MANTRQLKRRIHTAQNISKITKAMEMVAASKMKRAQDQAVAAKPYSHILYESLQKVSQVVDPNLHPLLSTHETGIDVAVILSTDKGLCGSLNAHLFKTLIDWQQQRPSPRAIVVGKKAVAFAKSTGLDVIAQFTDMPEKISLGDVLPISSMLMDGFLKQDFRSVIIIYMDFINTLSQQVKKLELLPLAQTIAIEDRMVETSLEKEYVFEPGAAQVLDKLLPFYVENAIYHAFLEAQASEHSARMVAMKNASENAEELVGELRLLFNKSRQESITNELLDITTASLALA